MGALWLGQFLERILELPICLVSGLFVPQVSTQVFAFILLDKIVEQI
jgi:hypothetical protein